MAAVAPTDASTQVTIRPFANDDLSVIIGWVGTPEDLRWLAPSTPWPLTVEKTLAWRREAGHRYGLYLDAETQPIGYGELNPMRSQPDQLWIGHVIVDPALQRRGYGTRFVTELVRLAFETQKATRLILVVFPANTTAIQCYHRVGFRTVGEERHAFGSSTQKHRLLRLEMTPKDRARI